MRFLKNRWILGSISVVLALILMLFVMPFWAKKIDAKVDIIRAKTDINEGQKITKQNIQIVKMSHFNLPNEVIKKEDLVLGKFADVKITKGDFLFLSKLSDTKGSKYRYLDNMPEGKRAISLSLEKLSTSVSAKLKAGDIVSIFATFNNENHDTVLDKSLKFVKVLSLSKMDAEDYIQIDEKTQDKSIDRHEKQIPVTITFLVSEYQAKILAGYEAEAKIHLALVSRDENRRSEVLLLEQDKIISDIIENQKQNEFLNYVDENDNDENIKETVDE